MVDATKFLLLLLVVSLEASSQYTVYKLSGGPSLCFSAFREKNQSEANGFSAKVASLGNLDFEIQFHPNTRFFSSYGASLSLNGYRYSHIVYNDSFQTKLISSTSSRSYGLFSNIGYRFNNHGKMQLMSYIGLKACYASSDFQFYIPFGFQAGLQDKKNKRTYGVAISYNFLLKPVYEKISVSYPYKGLTQPFVAEIRKFNSHLNISLYASFYVLRKITT